MNFGRSTSVRFLDRPTIVPGPGAYSVRPMSRVEGKRGSYESQSKRFHVIIDFFVEGYDFKLN
jgi:hypothetical protein